MFPDLFDGIFATCELGSHKRDEQFFLDILSSLRQDLPDLKPEQVVYFDDNRDGLITAAELGIATYLYEGVEQVKEVVG